MGWADRRYDEPKQRRVFVGQEGIMALLFLFFAFHLVSFILDRGGMVRTSTWIEFFSVSGVGLRSGRLWTLFTAPLVHRDLIHLVGSSAFLFVVGRVYESFVGSRKTLLIFFLGSAAGYLSVLLPKLPELTLAYGSRTGLVAMVVALLFLAPSALINLWFFSIRVAWFGGAFLAFEAIRSMKDFQESRWSLADPWWSFVGATSAAVCFCLLSYGWPKGLWRRQANRRARKRDVRKLEAEISQAQELDRLLAKINDEGMASLSAKEQEFLTRMSKRMARRE